MTTVQHSTDRPAPTAPGASPTGERPPDWALDLVAGAGPPRPLAAPAEGVELETSGRSEDGALLLTARLPDVLDLDETTFDRRVGAAYDSILEQLEESDGLRPVRIWNHIPRLLSPLGGLPQRYMVFNGARIRSFRRVRDARRGVDRLPDLVPTASGTGGPGRDLWIHCLALSARSKPVENPRQVPAYRYSTRYGPDPPCFARSTAVDLEDGRRWLLIGGTAAVRGELSACVGDLDGQLSETFVNLEALVHAGLPAPATAAPPLAECGSFRHLRAYYPRARDRRRIEAAVAESLPMEEGFESLVCDLCRPELLVEIEGLFEYRGRSDDPQPRQ